MLWRVGLGAMLKLHTPLHRTVPRQQGTLSREVSPDQERWNITHTTASFCLSSYLEGNSKEEIYINSPATLTVLWEHEIIGEEIMGEKVMYIVNRDNCLESQVMQRPLHYCTYQCKSLFPLGKSQRV